MQRCRGARGVGAGRRAVQATIAGAVLVSAAIARAAPGAGALLVGWGGADITPDRPVAIAGQMRTRISKGVRDPITCTALALESRPDGGPAVQAIMVSCDLVAIGPQLERALATLGPRLAADCPGIDPAMIVLNATHSHAAPVTSDGEYDLPAGAMTGAEYAAFAADRIAAAVTSAWNARAPGRVGWALAHAVVAQNRRVVSFDAATGLPEAGRTTMYGKTDADDFDSLEGPADTAVPVVAFWDADDALSGLILNLACPAQATAQLGEISADFWHETRVGLRGTLGAGVFVLPQCAAAAGASPEPLVRTVAEEEMLRRRGLSSREEIARRIVAAVGDVVGGAKQEATADPPLLHSVRMLELPQRLVTVAERDRCLADAAAAPPERPAKSRWYAAVAARYDRQQAILARGGKPVVKQRVHAIRLGDVAFVTNGFELFEEYGIRIQARSPATLTCVVQLAGGGPAGTYVPTARAVAGGGYSALVESNLVGPEGGRMLVDESVAMLRELWSRPSPPARTADR